MKNYIIALLTLTIIGSCDDIIEAELKNKEVHVLAPINNTVSSNYNQSFIWEDLKGATAYQIQIVSPSFSAIQTFIEDSTVHATHFSRTLQPGVYEWRIRAKNNSSSTNYQTYKLTIDSTNDLTGQQVLLLTPENNQSVNSLSQVFTWEAMPAATNYVFQAFTSSNTPIAGSLQSVSTNSANYSFSTTGSYRWKVYAQNSTSTTLHSEFNLNIDTVRPSTPVIISPANDTNSIILNPVQLKWNTVSTAIEYQIEVSDSPSFPGEVDTLTSSTTYNFYAPAGIIYYWRVRAIDNATNESNYSTTRFFRRN